MKDELEHAEACVLGRGAAGAGPGPFRDRLARAAAAAAAAPPPPRPGPPGGEAPAGAGAAALHPEGQPGGDGGGEEGGEEGRAEELGAPPEECRAMEELEAEGGGPSFWCEARGRIGPATVTVRPQEVQGEAALSPDGLGLESHSNFVSVHANVCVADGKWMYEVTLGTAGIQQLGWATLDCPCNNEEGVGDFPNSYAYDGKRIKKWNVECQAYGHAWMPGDVIGCCIDLAAGEIWYRRNGVCLGKAFSQVRRYQKGIAYFPALSLSHGERCRLNFGGRPFQYPVAGFVPLQRPPPQADLRRADFLLGALERCVECWHALPLDDALLMAHAILEDLAPLLGRPYLADAVLLPCFLEAMAADDGGAKAATWVEVLSAALEEEELDACLQYLVLSLSDRCRTALACPGRADPGPCEAFRACVEEERRRPAGEGWGQGLRPALRARLVHYPWSPAATHSSLGEERGSWRFLRAAIDLLLQHDALYRRWTASGYFYASLEGFLTRKQPNANDLAVMLPAVWWKGCKGDDGCSEEEMRAADRGILQAIEAIEECQYTLFSHFIYREGEDGSRLIEFLGWLIKKNKGVTRNVHPPGLSNNSVLVSTYFLLCRILFPEFRPFHSGLEATRPAMKRKYFPKNLTETTDVKARMDLARLGGTFSHLDRTAKVEDAGPLCPLPLDDPHSGGECEECGKEEGIQVYCENCPHAFPTKGGKRSETEQQAEAWVCAECKADEASGSGKPRAEEDPYMNSALFHHLFDGLSLVYYLGMSTNFKNASYHQLIQRSGISQLDDLDRRIALQASRDRSSFLQADQLKHMQDTRVVFLQDVVDSVRQCSWYKATMYQEWKLKSMLAACGLMARLILRLSERGAVFQYVPECYIEAMVDSFHALRRGDPQFATFPAMPDLSLDDLITCLVRHFSDTRIVNPDVRDIILQSMSMMLQHEQFVPAFEGNLSAKKGLVRKLLDSFDARFWIPISNILIRLCKGKGFGQGGTFTSDTFQARLRTSHSDEPEIFNNFMTRLFNMLNWTATEFSVSIKELLSSNMDHQQQQRKCSIMFELTCNLLRLIEFFAIQNPSCLVGGEDFEVKVPRLVETVAFIISHTTQGSDSSDFVKILKMASPAHPTLEKISQAAISAPLAGLMVNLLATEGDLEGTGWAAGRRPLEEAAHEHLYEVIGANGTLTEENLEFMRSEKLAETFKAQCEKVPTEAEEGALAAVFERMKGAIRRQKERDVQAQDDEDIPEDFLDPIQCTLMTDPVKLPDSGITVDRSTIKRHLMCDSTDPFSRAELKLVDVIANTELKGKIEAWKLAR